MSVTTHPNFRGRVLPADRAAHRTARLDVMPGDRIHVEHVVKDVIANNSGSVLIRTDDDRSVSISTERIVRVVKNSFWRRFFW